MQYYNCMEYNKVILGELQMPVNSFDDYPMSWKPTLTDRRGPIYTRLAKQLADDIQSGVLKPGDKLPPQRELADFLDLHFSTITRAYKLCEEQGLICAKVGQGTFVSSDVSVSDTLLYAQESADCIQMGTVLPPSNGNERIIAFVKDMLNQPDVQTLLDYHSPVGSYAQRRTVKRWLEGITVHTTPDNILFASGSQNALCAALLGLFQAGDRIGTTALSFSGLKSIAKMLGVQLVALPEQDGHLHLEALERFCKTENLKGLYLTPDQSNPTTYSLRPDERSHIGDIAQKLNLIVLEDAINRMFSDEACPPLHRYAPQNTVYIFSVSKFLSAGLRVAYLVCPDAYVPQVQDALYNMNLVVSPLNLEVVNRLLNSPLLPDLLGQKKAELIKRNRLADELLSGYPLLGPPACCFRWLPLPAPWRGQAFEEAAQRGGVQVFCAERFAVGKATPPNAVRICVSAPKNTQELAKGLERIRATLA